MISPIGLQWCQFSHLKKKKTENKKIKKKNKTISVHVRPTIGSIIVEAEARTDHGLAWVCKRVAPVTAGPGGLIRGDGQYLG